jgi:hypothetical protein
LASFLAEIWCSFTLAVYLFACFIDDILSGAKTCYEHKNVVSALSGPSKTQLYALWMGSI